MSYLQNRSKIRAYPSGLVFGVALLTVLWSSFQLSGIADRGETHTLGYIEPICIEEANLRLDAKLDTGAAISSIRAKVLNADELNLGDGTVKVKDKKDAPKTSIGKPIRFELADDRGRTQVVELPLVGVIPIKLKEGGYVYRPEVEMTFHIDGRPVRERVNLAPRPNFDYAVLIGRNMLSEGNILVDASRRYSNGRKAKMCRRQ